MYIKNEKARYWLSLLSLGFMGGTIYLLPYIRYVFYDQMIGTMSSSVFSVPYTPA